MQHIGIHTPEDRIDFVRKQGIPIFIASKPFLEMEQYSIPVRLYTFAYNSTLSDANIFSTYIGQQRLCLDAADYEYLLEKYGREALSAYTARIRDLEETITNLQGALSVQQTKMNDVMEQNQILLAEKAEYQNKKRTLSGREKSLESRQTACPACYLSSGEPIGCRGRAWNQVHPHQNSGRIFTGTRSLPGTQARCSGCASYTPKSQKQYPL